MKHPVKAVWVLLGPVPVVVAAAATVQLDGFALQLAAVEDSASYYIYRYELQNSANSEWAIAAVTVDIGASTGTPANLPSTGSLLDITASGGAPVEPHAEVGPISPTGWDAILDRKAGLTWAPPNSRAETLDSVAPGGTKSGFGIRSSYLPGLTSAVATPTLGSCCLEPADTTDDAFYPMASDFRITANAVVPRYAPAEVDLSVLQSQLSAVCDDPLWIPSTTLCSTLADSLDAAHNRFAINNWWGGMAAIDSVASIVLASPADSIESPARWMLYRNAQQVVENTLAQSPGAGTATLCAEGPSSTTAYFTITATEPDVLASPYQVVAEVPGVDPHGSSCAEVWRMGLGVAQLADVTVALDSVSAGADFDRFEATGAGTIVQHGSDWVTTRHDGETGATIWYYFVASQQE